VGYALGTILGGAFAASIAQWLITSYGQSFYIGIYIMGLALVSLVAVSTTRERMGVDLQQ
jgi:hypothetical protein